MSRAYQHETYAADEAAELRDTPTGPPDHATPEADFTPHADARTADRWCPGWRDWTDDPWQKRSAS